MNQTPEDRRPIGLRRFAVIQRAAQALAEAGIRPNWISLSSLGFAAIALFGFWVAREIDSSPFLGSVGLLIAMTGIVGRLLANLFDGLVAVEGGIQSPKGAYWNEVPDRPADLMILAGFGLAAGSLSLGLVAGALAILIAYVREFGARVTGEMDYAGPLAKQHRMVLVIAVSLSAFVCLFFAPDFSQALLLWGLWGLILGSVATFVYRSWRLIGRLP